MPKVYSPDLFNQIRNEMDASFQERIPQATQTSIHEFVGALINHQADYNAFVPALLRRLSKTVMMATEFTNPLAHLKKDAIRFGDTIRELYYEPVKAEGEYDPKGLNPLGRRSDGNVLVRYHKPSRQDQYCISIGKNDFLDASTSASEMDSFLSAKMKALYTGVAIDEYLVMRETINYAISGQDPSIVVPRAYLGNIIAQDKDSALKIIQAIKYIENDMKFVSTEFTQAGVMSTAKPSDMVLFLNKDVKPNIDIYGLSGVYNLDKVGMPASIETIDTFKDPNIIGVYAHKDWAHYHDRYYEMLSIMNPQGIFENHFLHVWAWSFVSAFAPLVVLLKGNAPVDGKSVVYNARDIEKSAIIAKLENEKRQSELESEAIAEFKAMNK